MTKASIVILGGDGIGPEVTHEGVRVLEAVASQFGHDFRFEAHLIGGAAIDATRRRVDAVMRAIRDQVAPSGSYQADGRMQTLAKSPSIQAGGRLV